MNLYEEPFSPHYLGHISFRSCQYLNHIHKIFNGLEILLFITIFIC